MKVNYFRLRYFVHYLIDGIPFHLLLRKLDSIAFEQTVDHDLI